MNIIETNLQFGAMTKRKETKRIILHHSGVSVLQSIETIHNYHKNTNGWSGIGYHFYVRKDGSIYRGRPEQYVGAHAYGANNDSIGICFEGNYDVESMPEVQKEAGKELVSYLKEKYNINTVLGHRDTIATSCPGKNFPFDEIATVEKNTTVEEQTTKSIEDLANEVIAGKYGVGQARKQALGSLYNEVQARVNEILLGKKSNKKSNEEIAQEIIVGKWGNNPQRKQKLLAEGYDYDAIQKIVNQKLK